MHRLLIGVMAVAICGAALVDVGPVLAISGQYVSMTVEVQQQPGIWATLSESSLGASYSGLSSSELSSYWSLATWCSNSGSSNCACGANSAMKATYASSIAPQLGKTYRVRLQNLTSCRIGVVLGIDGMNTANGQHVGGTSEDTKWVLKNQASALISGWQVTQNQALEFYFTIPADSASPYKSEAGEIKAYVFFESPDVMMTFSFVPDESTGAGSVIQQNTTTVEFDDALAYPVETLLIRYSQTSAASGRPSLGLTCQATFGLGVIITAVDAGKPAQRAGLQVGDIITQVDGQYISSCQDIANILDTKSSGDYMVFQVHRGSGTLLISVKLG